ncbi:MAG: hypothetical protein KKA81_03320 [Bacteroidetes bacterium]|nr:hypothetical protein [Bacteroidota bacterium]
MKKLILSIALVSFLLFGVVGIQTVVASQSNVVIENLDKDPKKDNDKEKKAECKDAKLESKKDCPEGSKSKCCDKTQMKSKCCKGSDGKENKKSDPDKK